MHMWYHFYIKSIIYICNYFYKQLLVLYTIRKKSENFIALKVLSQRIQKLELLNLYKHRFIALVKIQFEMYTIYIDCIQLIQHTFFQVR